MINLEAQDESHSAQKNLYTLFFVLQSIIKDIEYLVLCKPLEKGLKEKYLGAYPTTSNILHQKGPKVKYSAILSS